MSLFRKDAPVDVLDTDFITAGRFIAQLRGGQWLISYISYDKDCDPDIYGISDLRPNGKVAAQALVEWLDKVDGSPVNPDSKDTPCPTP